MTRFLSFLLVACNAEKCPDPDAVMMTAERFIAKNMDDPDTDFL